MGKGVRHVDTYGTSLPLNVILSRQAKSLPSTPNERSDLRSEAELIEGSPMSAFGTSPITRNIP
jgi:hypothetical protein